MKNIRQGFEFTVWLTAVIVIGVLLAATAARAQQNEVRLGGNLIASEGSGYGFPFWGGSVGGQIHLKGFDLGGGYARTNFPKIGTPGGYRDAKEAYVNRWFGDHVFAGVGYERVFGDAKVWTKTVDFVGVAGGYRFIGGPRFSSPQLQQGSDGKLHPVRYMLAGRHEDIVSFSFDKEVKTDAVQPNRVNAFSLRWYHDFPLTAHQVFRWAVSYQYSTYDQIVTKESVDRFGGITRYGELERLSGSSVSVALSYVIKGS